MATKPNNLSVQLWDKADAVKNSPFTAGQPSGIMPHSTATPGVTAQQFRDRWNKPGVGASVHFFLDDKGIIQCLPLTQISGHCGAAANKTHISFEICEPAGFSYSGATMVGYDAGKHEAYFRAAWDNAVALCVWLCKEYGFKETDILCHSEGYKKGIASNHADVMHWFPKHGENMDTFRAEVRDALGDGPVPTEYTLTRKLWYAKPLMNGNDVLVVQKRLVELGYKDNMLAPDGNYGERTKNAVIAYQKAKGIAADGVVGPNTAKAMGLGYEVKTATFAISRKLYQGCTGNDVLTVQVALVGQGYQGNMLKPDGTFGPRTRSAVMAFQKARGLIVDGVIGQHTTAALGGVWKG